MLEVRNLNVSYGKVKVIKSVSLGVEDKQTFALIGANGAGKTTMIRAIMGLKSVESGEVRFLGEDITNMKPFMRARMGIAMVPEGRQLFYDYTVKENLMIGAFHRTNRNEVSQTLEEVLQMFPILKERESQRARTLSGGEGQMLSIARALMADPKLILMDEPSMGIMPTIVGLIFEIIRRLREEGKTIFIVEQNVVKALDVAQTGALLELGQIVLSGNTQEISSNPKIKESYLGE